MTFKKAMEPTHIEIEFDVGIGDEPYAAHIEEVLERIASELESYRKPHFNVKRGEINVQFHDGHNGITPEMNEFVVEVRRRVEQLNVQMTGSGMGAFSSTYKGKKMSVALKASLQHEFDFRPSQGHF